MIVGRPGASGEAAFPGYYEDKADVARDSRMNELAHRLVSLVLTHSMQVQNSFQSKFSTCYLI